MSNFSNVINSLRKTLALLTSEFTYLKFELEYERLSNKGHEYEEKLPEITEEQLSQRDRAKKEFLDTIRSGNMEESEANKFIDRLNNLDIKNPKFEMILGDIQTEYRRSLGEANTVLILNSYPYVKPNSKSSYITQVSRSVRKFMSNTKFNHGKGETISLKERLGETDSSALFQSWKMLESIPKNNLDNYKSMMLLKNVDFQNILLSKNKEFEKLLIKGKNKRPPILNVRYKVAKDNGESEYQNTSIDFTTEAYKNDNPVNYDFNMTPVTMKADQLQELASNNMLDQVVCQALGIVPFPETQGSNVFIMGPSGSGKSAAFRGPAETIINENGAKLQGYDFKYGRMNFITSRLTSDYFSWDKKTMSGIKTIEQINEMTPENRFKYSLGLIRYTSGNPDSSRAIVIAKYLIKINQIEKELNIWDLPGNEDPYTIMSTMMPSGQGYTPLLFLYTLYGIIQYNKKDKTGQKTEEECMVEFVSDIFDGYELTDNGIINSQARKKNEFLISDDLDGNKSFSFIPEQSIVTSKSLSSLINLEEMFKLICFMLMDYKHNEDVEKQERWTHKEDIISYFTPYVEMFNARNANKDIKTFLSLGKEMNRKRAKGTNAITWELKGKMLPEKAESIFIVFKGYILYCISRISEAFYVSSNTGAIINSIAAVKESKTKKDPSIRWDTHNAIKGLKSIPDLMAMYYNEFKLNKEPVVANKTYRLKDPQTDNLPNIVGQWGSKTKNPADIRIQDFTKELFGDSKAQISIHMKVPISIHYFMNGYDESDKEVYVTPESITKSIDEGTYRTTLFMVSYVKPLHVSGKREDVRENLAQDTLKMFHAIRPPRDNIKIKYKAAFIYNKYAGTNEQITRVDDETFESIPQEYKDESIPSFVECSLLNENFNKIITRNIDGLIFPIDVRNTFDVKQTIVSETKENLTILGKLKDPYDDIEKYAEKMKFINAFDPTIQSMDPYVTSKKGLSSMLSVLMSEIFGSPILPLNCI